MGNNILLKSFVVTFDILCAYIYYYIYEIKIPDSTRGSNVGILSFNPPSWQGGGGGSAVGLRPTRESIALTKIAPRFCGAAHKSAEKKKPP